MEKNQMEHQNQIKAIFTQLVDHFDVLNNNTWSQEYFVDATYWKGPGPIFIYIGAELLAGFGFWHLVTLIRNTVKYRSICKNYGWHK